MNLKDFIIPTKLDNTDENQESGNKSFQTEDLIYLDSYDEVADISEDERITYPTDYAIMNFVAMSFFNQGPKDRKVCWAWLRSADSSHSVHEYYHYSFLDNSHVYRTDGGLCPAMHLNLSSIISMISISRDFFKISEVKIGESINYHTIEFGEYPKSYVGDGKNEELERLYSYRRLASTGKTYTGRIDKAGKLILHSEFEYEGQKYVRVLTKKYYGASEYSDGTMAPEDGTYMWVKVEPIVWKIRNWDELPKEINPTGSGKAKFIDIRTDEAIISGIPFYPYYYDENCSMWQNSTIRGYLNGINVNNIKTNGNTRFTASKGGNFTGKNNFLSEALNIELSLVHSKQEQGENNERAMLVNELQQQTQQELQQTQQVLKPKPNITPKTNITPKNKYKITIDEFWHSNSYLAIYCKFRWQSKILCQAFNKMGVCKANGEIYFEGSVFSDTNFTNVGEIGSGDSEDFILYDFEEVDLSKYISNEQIELIKNKLPTRKTISWQIGDIEIE